MKFGNFIKFIPDPVIVGFTSGIGVLIWFSQWPAFLGLPKVMGEHFHQKLWHLITILPEVHWVTAGLALFSLLILVSSSRLPYIRKIPAPLLVMLLCTGLQEVFHFNGVATIGSQFGGIPQGLPTFQAIPLTVDQVILLLGPAFTIAMLGVIESLLSAVVADGMAGTKHDSNQELIGQGMANIIAPFFGGFAATGAIARTATNVRYGGNSPLAGMVHSITLILIVIFLAPFAGSIPLCSLAAILFVVAYNMSEIGHFTHIVKFAPKSDTFILLTTFVLTIVADLVVAVNIGMILAMLHFLGKMSSTAEVRSIQGDDLTKKIQLQSIQKLPPELVVYSIEGPFFFGAVEKFERALAATHTEPKVILIRLGHVPFMDITGLEALEEVIKDLHKRGIRLLLSEANERVYLQLDRIGILKSIGVDGYYHDFSSALIYSNHLLPSSI